MQICGFQKTTLLDFPGKVAATIFIGGCNFRCPFCHNASLVTNPASLETFSKESILSFLKKRKGILDGVCITGGEPTLAPDLEDFIRAIKDIGYLIKLDTNGYRPDIIKALINESLLDYIAMDIKSSLSRYRTVSGLSTIDLNLILESIELIMSSDLSYEFRTTVADGLHTEKDFKEIAALLAGCGAYYLQSFQDSGDILCNGCSTPSIDTMEHYRNVVSALIPNTFLRGIEAL